MLSRSKLWLPSLVTGLLVGCGSAPALKSQSSAEVPAAASSQVVFFYQEAELTAKTVIGSGGGEMMLGETGFYGFGDALARRSKPALERSGITVVHAAVLPAGDLRTNAANSLAGIGKDQLRDVSMLIVTPLGGSTGASRTSVRAQVTFDVRLVAMGSFQPLWHGTVDTSTWKGRDIFNRNVPGNRFDDAYADQFLDAVANRFVEGADRCPSTTHRRRSGGAPPKPGPALTECAR